MEKPLPPPDISTAVSPEVREILGLPVDPTEIASSGLLGTLRFANPRGEEFRTEKPTIALIAQKLQEQGEKVSSFYLKRFTDRRFLEGMTHTTDLIGTDILDYMKHSNRYSMIDRFTLHDRKNQVTIPESADNLHASGHRRRAETHDGFDMENVIAQGIDPNYVLYFRATRPSATPKPEYYWTSDFWEVNYGLSQEGSNRHRDSIVLVSTLAQIAENGGLMIDVNDDAGIAVRQIGLASYDQNDALFSYSLYDYQSPSTISG